MKLRVLLAVAILGAGPVIAQSDGQTQLFEKPYWTEQPVLEALGRAKLELPPNRGQFSVRFVETDRDAKTAMQAAVERARAAYAAVKAVSEDASEVTTSVSVNPYYEQYRDRDGDRIENRRADKVIGYEARVSVDVLMKDVALAGTARAAALALGPEESDQLRVSLERSTETLRLAYEAAVEDGAARAQLSAAAAGTSLGRLLVIQEGQGPCLGQWWGEAGSVFTNRASDSAREMRTVSVTASRIQSVPAVSASEIEALNLPSDRPSQTVEAQVCMINAIGE